jgi:hypothetical protein
MDVGMLWFDNNKAEKLETKIQQASSYYKKKYGQPPNLCFVHPSMLLKSKNASQEEIKEKKAVQLISVGLELRSSKSLLPNHFWLGINQKSSAA